MPEGDAVWRTARRLHEALAGRVLVSADLRWPSLATSDLSGLTVTEVVPRGKHLLLRLDNGWTLHSHLRMDGSWRVERTRPGPVSSRRTPSRISQGPGFVRAVLVTGEWTAVGVDLGTLDLVRTEREDTLVGHLGPDLLDPGFDAGVAVANLEAAPGTIGAALMDQTNLAGIGTIWASETLFAERIPPWTPASDLGADRLARIVERARLLLNASIASPVPTSTGQRAPGRTSYVHGRSGRPGRRCGATVRVASIGGAARERPMFYCPRCQGGLGPTDAGRPISPLGSRPR